MASFKLWLFSREFIGMKKIENGRKSVPQNDGVSVGKWLSSNGGKQIMDDLSCCSCLYYLLKSTFKPFGYNVSNFRIQNLSLCSVRVFLHLEVFVKWLIMINFVGLLKLWLSWKCLQAIFSSTFFISFQWLLKFSPTCHSSHTEKSHFKVPLQPVTEKIMCKKLYRTVKTENKLYYGTKCFLYNFLSCFLCLHMNILEIKFQSE